MRRHGRVDSAAGLGLHGHGCWLYSDEAEFRAGALDFLAEGAELDQRMLYVGAGTIEKLRSDLGDLPGLDRLLGDGALRIMALEALYEVGVGVDPMAQLAMYSAATRTALVDGYAGLRVLAEVTPLVLDPELWRAHTHWEAVADRYMAKHPMSALCCYDRRLLPDAILRDLACVHRSSNAAPAMAPFRLFAGREGLSLAGEVDSFSAEHLRRLLAATLPAEGELVLELDELRFIDHHGVMAIAEVARELQRDGRAVRFLGAPRSFDRLASLLEVEL
ncbi:MAG TPA: MEDS domain-containing protein [Thermoleophilaceae bacterium]|jgi:ABC-type transporter Mla MlaB component